MNRANLLGRPFTFPDRRILMKTVPIDQLPGTWPAYIRGLQTQVESLANISTVTMVCAAIIMLINLGMIVYFVRQQRLEVLHDAVIPPVPSELKAYRAFAHALFSAGILTKESLAATAGAYRPRMVFTDNVLLISSGVGMRAGTLEENRVAVFDDVQNGYGIALRFLPKRDELPAGLEEMTNNDFVIWRSGLPREIYNGLHAV
ncbi:MAG: hypothetical protein NUV56_01965 [Candidatus Uhrbacteria bacterium]|nr:hypothetical protein [Candidatus Uhrbacteria bacterium]